MGKLKSILLMVAGFALAALAQEDSAKVEDIAFSKAYLGIEGGEVYPFGDLIDAVENTLYGGLNFRYSYWKNVDGVVMFHYAYFKPRPDVVPYDGVHQASGKLGLDWRFPAIHPMVFGGGFACNWTRADLDDDVVKDEIYEKPGGTLGDNETEFGWYARLNVVLWNLETYRVGFNFMWEEIWTLPKRSDMLYAGIYVERKLW
ncbi:hypothetical protein [Fibrobacter sp. UWB5]|jgi:hypothetical protein|uniref:hypothetical protein n=1 Tax=Fibrobacter sp. UWB5 TaxID=1964360 RepID=UPI0011863828|nr:hypothetical protein [Fibrobacter sp. UWB5]